MGYFRNIVKGFSTIFEGLTITASHLFRRPITVQYPDRTPRPVKDMLTTRYRGFLDVDMEICTGCLLCMQSCPIACIEIGIIKSQGSITPQRLISKFDIDIGKCMFCGLCTEQCPTNAIRFTREFEGATSNLGDLIFKFVEDGKPVAPCKKGT